MRRISLPFAAASQYTADAVWRSLCLIEILGQRALNMQDHEAAGMPPLLHFESEQIADGHQLSVPTNYRLLRVTRCGSDHFERYVRKDADPVLVVDPRAGHGPGIGGFRRDSEVGMALREGHPVYFVVFDPHPVAGQTMAHVLETIAEFISIVSQRHGDRLPIAYGNCQAGWALLLALSHCNRAVRLVVVNGSPLSYWAGEPGVNPMRLLAGFTGGIWPTHMLADLGNGEFDGAWLVQNFEQLKPEGIWKKYDAVFADPRRERERFLEFERWWNGFYFLGREEILPIVRDLFIGNGIQKGEVQVDAHCHANLRRLKSPLVIFCSLGDNITPPDQALGWLRAVYGSTQELIQAGQRIVYLLHPSVGHLGIFVSGDIARREHRAILHYAERIEKLAPGLYEMQISNEINGDDAPHASFHAKRLEDLAFDALPSGFEEVQRQSAALDTMYSSWISPAIRLLAGTPGFASAMEALHPMRTSRQAWLPMLSPVGIFAPILRAWADQLGAQDDQRINNPFYQYERLSSEALANMIGVATQWRDDFAEVLFRQLYDADDSAEVVSHAVDLPAKQIKSTVAASSTCAGHTVTPQQKVLKGSGRLKSESSSKRRQVNKHTG